MSPPPNFAIWERAIEHANHAFHRHAVDVRVQYAGALRHARLLLAEVRARAEGADDSDMLNAAIAACVVSHHNVAELHRENGGIAAATRHYRHAHRVVCGLCGDPSLCPALREVAAHHATRTLGELLAFRQAFGDCPRIAATRH